MSLNVLVTAPIGEGAKEALGRLGSVEVTERWDPYEPPDSLVAADILIVRGLPLIGATAISAAPRLRVIGRTGAGYDNIDLGAANARGIPVVAVPAEGTTPVAEGTMALILCAAKRLLTLDHATKSGDWDSRFRIEGLDLEGATLGIVGYGNIGSRVASLGRAFGMAAVACDPRYPSGSGPDGISFVSLEELASVCDVLSLHCELTDETRGMVDRELLRMVKPGAILVNVARGGVVESDDVLLEALEEGWLGAVALDVYAMEPPDVSHPLFSHPRVLCTPHAIALTRNWSDRVFAALVSSIEDVLKGHLPTTVVNRERIRPQVHRVRLRSAGEFGRVDHPDVPDERSTR